MKKFIIISLALLVLLSSGIVYLNKVLLPVKVKSMVVSAIEKQTGKKVILKSLEFNIFRGFVLQDLVIMDGQQVILSARQTNCVVFFWPIFRKQIIIPSINIRSPYIFLQRRKDNTFNLQELLGVASPAVKKPGFSIAVYKISISSGSMLFQDDTLAAKFTKEINNIHLNLQLKLPLAVGFNFKGEIPAEPVIAISGKGQYSITSRQLTADLWVKNLAPTQFEAYYVNSALKLVSGTADLQAKINLKEELLSAQIDGRGNNLVLEKDKLRIKFNPVLKTSIDYDRQAKKLKLDGYCDIEHAGITGLEFLGEVKELSGKVVFNQDSLSAQRLKADLLGMPFELNLTVKDFKTPAFNISTDLNLSFLPAIAKEKFNFTYVNSAQGKATMALKIFPDNKGIWQVQGGADISGGALKLGKQDIPVENISGHIGFSRDGASWSDLKFKYAGMDYQTAGRLADFSAPGVEMKLFAKDISLSGNFNVAGKKIKIGLLKGKYFDSEFSASGSIDNSDSSKPQADLIGTISFSLADLSKILEKDPAIKLMRPAGRLDGQFSLAGDPRDLKNCFIQARLTGNNLSLYGLNSREFSLDYLQEQKLAKIISSRIALYDGAIELTGIMNMETANLPYHLEVQAVGIKLDKLKMDTPVKDKDISGTLDATAKLNGFSGDLGKLSGSGTFQVREGKLWELNLFQGMGKMLFAKKDFANIMLSACSAAFLVNNRFVYTDNLRLVSDIADLSGPVKIGFDGSLDAAFDVEIKSDMVPLSGTLKDVCTIIAGQAQKFGVIKLSGSLQDPKYVFKPAVTDIIKGITDTLFRRGQ